MTKFSENVEYDYRTPYKDSKFYNIRYEDSYFRKKEEFPEVENFMDDIDKVYEQLDKLKDNIPED